MKVLELFAGSRSVGKVAERMGMQVFSVDVKKFDKINLVQDIEYLTTNMIPFYPDIIWASPPCTTYSLAAISYHRDMTKPKTPFAKKSDNLVLNTLKIIKSYPKSKWFIENPRGMLCKMPFMKDLTKCTVWYCKYGDIRAKPTHIWSNHMRSLFNPNGWQPRPECYNGNRKCHHEAAPRGSKTGTQGIKGNYERSKIPELLIEEILRSVKTHKKIRIVTK